MTFRLRFIVPGLIAVLALSMPGFAKDVTIDCSGASTWVLQQH